VRRSPHPHTSAYEQIPADAPPHDAPGVHTNPLTNGGRREALPNDALGIHSLLLLNGSKIHQRPFTSLPIHYRMEKTRSTGISAWKGGVDWRPARPSSTRSASARCSEVNPSESRAGSATGGADSSDPGNPGGEKARNAPPSRSAGTRRSLSST
jgi:hypothetical protein